MEKLGHGEVHPTLDFYQQVRALAGLVSFFFGVSTGVVYSN
jgi:hypothetical protein